MELLNKYKNGNCTIEIYSDGTRIIEWPDGEEMKLEFPLNIDIRLMTKCDFGYNPTTGKSVCSFCHESARTDGKECDYDQLLSQLKHLPAGMELAIGINDFTEGLEFFLGRCKAYGFIVNGTVNQGALAKKSNREWLARLISNNLLKGVGVSYRPRMPDIPKEVIEYPNTVLHVIAGIDDFEGVKNLANQGVKKILVLGEKDFGFNKGNVNLSSESHKEWKARIMELAKAFDIISFDNLALEQLDIKSKLPDSMWKEFYQGEHSFYINAVDQYFAPSSRSNLLKKGFGETNLFDYFKMLESQLINVRDISN